MDFLRTYLVDRAIFVAGIAARDKHQAFQEMIHYFVREGKVQDEVDALHCLWERESRMTTGVVPDMGLPHGVCSLCSLADRFAVGWFLSFEGIDYDAMDGEPVHLLVCVLRQENQVGLWIEVANGISWMFSLPGAFDSVRTAKDPTALRAKVTQLLAEN